MSLSVYEMSVPLFTAALTNMEAWLDKALAEGKDERVLMEARLAPDMFALPRQYQIASDAAKSAVARLSGTEAPSMADTEASFAELKDRCRRTIEYVGSVDRASFDEGADREVVLKFPNGMGYRFSGREFLAGFAIPNFYFHVTTAYGLLRGAGVKLGKPDFLAHLGPPNLQG